MSNPTLHLVGLPHLASRRDSNHCAFVTKVWRASHFLPTTGWNVIHYGLEGSEVGCEHVQIMSAAERDKFYGVVPREASIDLDYDVEKGRHAKLWRLFNNRAAAEISIRSQTGDFFLTIAGTAQMPLAVQIGAMPKIVNGQPSPTEMIAIEFGIGYEGVFAMCRVFESYSHQSQTVGATGQHRNMNFFDAVIPNSYDATDFPAGKGDGLSAGMLDYFGAPIGREGEPYLLYVGRLTRQKGINIAVAAAKLSGMKLLIAGAGITEKHPTKIITKEFTIDEPHVRYIGVLGVEQRAVVMGAALALFVPSLYNEPFGSVAAEAQATGCPVISTDWGAFPETVEHGRTGFRCRNIRQFAAAVPACDALDRQYIRARALRLWSVDRVKWMYDAYFRRIAGGVNDIGLNRTDLPADLLALDQSHAWIADTEAVPEIDYANGNGGRMKLQL